MSSRWALPSALVVLPVTLAVATAALSVRGGLTEFTLTLLPSSAVGAIVGGLLAGLRPRYVGGWLMLTGGLAFLVGQLAEQVAYQGLVVSPGTVAYASTALWLGNWIFPPALVPLFVLVPLTFPDGHLPSRRWRPLLGFALLVVVELAVLGAFGSPTLRLGDQYWPNPFAITALAGLIPTALIAGAVATLAAAIAAAGSLVSRWRRADATGRRQILWVALATLVVTVGFAVDAAVAALAPWAYPAVFPVLQVVTVVGPLAIAVSILRHQLFDIEIVFSRALVYTVLTAVLLGAYVATVAIMTSLVPTTDVLGRLLGTAVVAVAFAPLRAWLQHLVRRRLFGGRAEPYAALTSLSRQLEAPTSPDRVLTTLATAVAQTLRSPYASVEIARHGTVTTAALFGQPPSNGTDVVAVDLTHGGQQVGRLVVGQRGQQAVLRSRPSVAGGSGAARGCRRARGSAIDGPATLPRAPRAHRRGRATPARPGPA